MKLRLYNLSSKYLIKAVNSNNELVDFLIRKRINLLDLTAPTETTLLDVMGFKELLWLCFFSE